MFQLHIYLIVFIIYRFRNCYQFIPDVPSLENLLLYPKRLQALGIQELPPQLFFHAIQFILKQRHQQQQWLQKSIRWHVLHGQQCICDQQLLLAQLLQDLFHLQRH